MGCTLSHLGDFGVVVAHLSHRWAGQGHYPTDMFGTLRPSGEEGGGGSQSEDISGGLIH